MKLHAGSLYKNYLVLYSPSDATKRIIKVDDTDLQWDIYCNDVEFTAKNSEKAEIGFNGKSYEFKYAVSENPMKDLGFGE